MARRKTKRSSSSGAPGIKNGPGIGPALNPIGMAQAGPGTKYIDGTVAAQAWKDAGGSEWDRFWSNEKAIAAFSRPVKQR